MTTVLISSRLGVVRVTYKTGFGLENWIYCTLYIHNPGLEVITAILLIYTLHSSPLHTHQGSQSSLFVSWQRIYNTRAVTSSYA
jgi:hypothetical protein